MTHIHGPEGGHAHGATAFTTWLDPTLALKQANAIRSTLAKLHPQNADDFQKNFDELKGDLEDLDLRIAHCYLPGHSGVFRASSRHPKARFLAAACTTAVSSGH